MSAQSPGGLGSRVACQVALAQLVPPGEKYVTLTSDGGGAQFHPERMQNVKNDNEGGTIGEGGPGGKQRPASRRINEGGECSSQAAKD